jgi:hypothetical protein
MSQLFLDTSRALLLGEYLPKIRIVVEPLTDADVWWRPTPDSNSIANLLLHLDGNARQWLLGGVAQRPNVRDRDAEFAARDGMGKVELVRRFADTLHEIDAMLAALPLTALDEPRRIQGSDTIVFTAIYHVVEHISMHTGQIIQLAKWRAPGQIRLYDASSDSFRPLYESELR